MADELELYKRYRPTSFGELVGQTDAKRMLADMGKRNEIPHTLLFTGPSGTGKTTIARILRHKLKCSDADFNELNAADVRGIDVIRSIRGHMTASPLGGKCRIWLMDECHSLTSDAQDAFLKILEDTPRHVYFMLASTDPQKLKKTILSRCTEVKCKLLTEAEIKELITRVLAAEKVTLSDAVINRITDVAEGSARKALVVLHAVYRLPDQNAQLSAVSASDAKHMGIEIARALMAAGTSWSSMANLLRGIEDEAETVRRIVLGYCKSVMINSNKDVARVAMIMEEFREPFYTNGMPDLVLACYNVIVNSR